MLLLWILLVDYWQHLFDPRVVRWLDNHHSALFDTSVSLVMIFQENSVVSVWRAILLQALSHIESLLAVCDASWSIRLNIRHIESSTIGWLAALIIHSHTTYLSWVMHLVNWHSPRFSIARSIRFNEAHIEIVLDIVTRNGVRCGSRTIYILLQLLGLTSNWINSLCVYSLNLIYFLGLLWCTKVNLAISWLWWPLWPSSIEKATANHCSLVHHQLLGMTPHDPIQAVALLWGTEINCRQVSCTLCILSLLVLCLLEYIVASSFTLELFENQIIGWGHLVVLVVLNVDTSLIVEVGIRGSEATTTIGVQWIGSCRIFIILNHLV